MSVNLTIFVKIFMCESFKTEVGKNFTINFILSPSVRSMKMKLNIYIYYFAHIGNFISGTVTRYL